MTNLKEAYKQNTLKLATHHRMTCDQEDCGVSLILLMTMAEENGVKFTKKEKREFL